MQAKEVFKNAKPSFLSYILELACDKHEDIHELCYCILFLRERRHLIRMVNAILHQLSAGSIEDMDESSLTELRRICEKYDIEMDERNRKSILDCLEDEKEALQADMKACDLGYEPGNLYSAVDAVLQAFNAYCKTYDMDDADINKELKRVITWLEENQNCFQELGEPED